MSNELKSSKSTDNPPLVPPFSQGGLGVLTIELDLEFEL